MELTQVKTLLGVDDERVDILYETISNRLVHILNRHIPDTLTVPIQLKYIVAEVTISRFNRLGSEGMRSETMDGHRADYVDTDLNDYHDVIAEYVSDNTVDTRRGKVRFL